MSATIAVPAAPARLPRLKVRLPGARFASTLVLLGVWQALSMAGVLSARTLAPPSRIVATAWDLTLSGVLPANLFVSLERAASGLAIGLALGAALALISGLSRRGEDIVDMPMQMLRTLPFLALVPLFILWFGIGEMPKIALVAMGTAFPFYINLFAGIRGTDPRLAEMGRVFGLSRTGLIRKIILPGALPSALVGLRHSLSVAWLSLVVAEQINAQSGIGYMISDARDFLRTDIIMVGLLLYALLGLTADLLVRALEARLLAWRPAAITG